jgi:hypothetical protein
MYTPNSKYEQYINSLSEEEKMRLELGTLKHSLILRKRHANNHKQVTPEGESNPHYDIAMEGIKKVEEKIVELETKLSKYKKEV